MPHAQQQATAIQRETTRTHLTRKLPCHSVVPQKYSRLEMGRQLKINLIRKRKKLPLLKKKTISYKIKRELKIEKLSNEFEKHLNLSSLLS